MNSFLPTVEKLPEGHPVKVYYEEGALIQDILLELYDVDPVEDFQKYFNIFNQLITIEKRFARKEPRPPSSRGVQTLPSSSVDARGARGLADKRRHNRFSARVP